MSIKILLRALTPAQRTWLLKKQNADAALRYLTALMEYPPLVVHVKYGDIFRTDHCLAQDVADYANPQVCRAMDPERRRTILLHMKECTLCMAQMQSLKTRSSDPSAAGTFVPDPSAHRVPSSTNLSEGGRTVTTLTVGRGLDHQPDDT